MKILAVIYDKTQVIDLWQDRKGRFMGEGNFLARFIGTVKDIYSHSGRIEIYIKGTYEGNDGVIGVVFADLIQKGD